MKKKNTFTCARCKKTYVKAWTDQEAMDEAKNVWNDELGEDLDVVCDDCYKEFEDLT